MFFDVAGGGPFGEFGGIVFAGVLDDGVQDVQRDGGLVRGVFQFAGGSGLRVGGGAFGGDDGFKGGDVRIELRDEIGGEADGSVDEDELLSAEAGDRIIGGVFEAEGVNGF